MNKNSSRTHPKSRPKPKGKPKSQQFAYHPLLNDPVDTLKRYEDRKSKKNEKLQSIKNRLQDALKEYDQVSYEAETGKPLEDGISDDVRARVHKVSEYNYDNAHNFLKTSFAQHNKTEKEKNAILADLQDWITRHVNDDEVVDMTETKLPSNIVPLTSDSDPIFITNPVLERTYSPTLSGTDNEPDETTNPVVPKLNMDALITSTQSARKSLERLHNGQLSTIRQKYFKEMEDLAWKYENTDDWVEEKIESLRREVEALTNQLQTLEERETNLQSQIDTKEKDVQQLSSVLTQIQEESDQILERMRERADEIRDELKNLQLTAAGGDGTEDSIKIDSEQPPTSFDDLLRLKQAEINAKVKLAMEEGVKEGLEKERLRKEAFVNNEVEKQLGGKLESIRINPQTVELTDEDKEGVFDMMLDEEKEILDRQFQPQFDQFMKENDRMKRRKERIEARNQREREKQERRERMIAEGIKVDSASESESEEESELSEEHHGPVSKHKHRHRSKRTEPLSRSEHTPSPLSRASVSRSASRRSPTQQSSPVKAGRTDINSEELLAQIAEQKTEIEYLETSIAGTKKRLEREANTKPKASAVEARLQREQAKIQSDIDAARTTLQKMLQEIEESGIRIKKKPVILSQSPSEQSPLLAVSPSEYSPLKKGKPSKTIQFADPDEGTILTTEEYDGPEVQEMSRQLAEIQKRQEMLKRELVFNAEKQEAFTTQALLMLHQFMQVQAERRESVYTMPRKMSSQHSVSPKRKKRSKSGRKKASKSQKSKDATKVYLDETNLKRTVTSPIQQHRSTTPDSRPFSARHIEPDPNFKLNASRPRPPSSKQNQTQKSVQHFDTNYSEDKAQQIHENNAEQIPPQQPISERALLKTEPTETHTTSRPTPSQKGGPTTTQPQHVHNNPPSVTVSTRASQPQMISSPGSHSMTPSPYPNESSPVFDLHPSFSTFGLESKEFLETEKQMEEFEIKSDLISREMSEKSSALVRNASLFLQTFRKQSSFIAKQRNQSHLTLPTVHSGSDQPLLGASEATVNTQQGITSQPHQSNNIGQPNVNFYHSQQSDSQTQAPPSKTAQNHSSTQQQLPSQSTRTQHIQQQHQIQESFNPTTTKPQPPISNATSPQQTHSPHTTHTHPNQPHSPDNSQSVTKQQNRNSHQTTESYNLTPTNPQSQTTHQSVKPEPSVNHNTRSSQNKKRTSSPSKQSGKSKQSNNTFNPSESSLSFTPKTRQAERGNSNTSMKTDSQEFVHNHQRDESPPTHEAQQTLQAIPPPQKSATPPPVRRSIRFSDLPAEPQPSIQDGISVRSTRRDSILTHDTNKHEEHLMDAIEDSRAKQFVAYNVTFDLIAKSIKKVAGERDVEENILTKRVLEEKGISRNWAEVESSDNESSSSAGISLQRDETSVHQTSRSRDGEHDARSETPVSESSKMDLLWTQRGEEQKEGDEHEEDQIPQSGQSLSPHLIERSLDQPHLDETTNQQSLLDVTNPAVIKQKQEEMETACNDVVNIEQSMRQESVRLKFAKLAEKLKARHTRQLIWEEMFASGRTTPPSTAITHAEREEQFDKIMRVVDRHAKEANTELAKKQAENELQRKANLMTLLNSESFVSQFLQPFMNDEHKPIVSQYAHLKRGMPLTESMHSTQHFDDTIDSTTNPKQLPLTIVSFDPRRSRPPTRHPTPPAMEYSFSPVLLHLIREIKRSLPSVRLEFDLWLNAQNLSWSDVEAKIIDDEQKRLHQEQSSHPHTPEPSLVEEDTTTFTDLSKERQKHQKPQPFLSFIKGVGVGPRDQQKQSKRPTQSEENEGLFRQLPPSVGPSPRRNSTRTGGRSLSVSRKLKQSLPKLTVRGFSEERRTRTEIRQSSPHTTRTGSPHQTMILPPLLTDRQIITGQ